MIDWSFTKWKISMSLVSSIQPLKECSGKQKLCFHLVPPAWESLRSNQSVQIIPHNKCTELICQYIRLYKVCMLVCLVVFLLNCLLKLPLTLIQWKSRKPREAAELSRNQEEKSLSSWLLGPAYKWCIVYVPKTIWHHLLNVYKRRLCAPRVYLRTRCRWNDEVDMKH